MKRTWAIGWLFHTAAFLALVGGPAPATGDPDAPAIVEEVPAETRPARALRRRARRVRAVVASAGPQPWPTFA